MPGSGAARLAISEMAVSEKYKNLKGKELSDALLTEMLEADEGSKEDKTQDKKEGVHY